MRERTTLWTMIGLALLLAAPAVGRSQADGAEAEQLYRDGRRLMADGDVPRACDAFEGSLRARPAARTHLALADCREQNAQYASAWAHYVEAARATRRGGAEPELEAVADARALALEPRLSFLTVNVPEEARVDGLEVTRNGEPLDPAAWNRALPVDGGIHVVEGKAPAFEPWATAVTVADERDRQSVNVPRFATLVRTGRTAPSPDGARAGASLDGLGGSHGALGSSHGGHAGVVDTAAAPALTGRRTAALITWGVGAAALGGALAFELAGRDTYADALAARDPDLRRSLTDDANRQRTVAMVAGGLGLAAGAVGLYLWLDGAPERPRRPTLQPAVTPSSAHLLLSAPF